jgi:WD40 repeat protein
MHVGEIGNEEVLVTTDDSGHISVHFPHNPTRPALTMKLPLSAWGIDTHSSRRLLVVSCNAHIVTVYHLGMGIDDWRWTTTSGTTVVATGESYHQTEFLHLGGRVAAAVEAAEGGFPSLTLVGHRNNIPCVAFDRTGSYVVSGSLDKSVRMWDCRSGYCLWTLETTEYAPWILVLCHPSLFYFYSETVCRRRLLIAVSGASNSSTKQTSYTTTEQKKVLSHSTQVISLSYNCYSYDTSSSSPTFLCSCSNVLPPPPNFHDSEFPDQQK